MTMATTEREYGENNGIAWQVEGDYVAVKIPVKTDLYPNGMTMRFKGSYTPGDKVTEDGVTKMLGGETSAETIGRGIEPDFANIEKAAEGLSQAMESAKQAKKLVDGIIAIIKVLRPISYKGNVSVDGASLGREILRREFGGNLATVNLSIGDMITNVTALEKPGFDFFDTIGRATPDEVWRKSFALEGLQFEFRGNRANYVMALDRDGRYFYDPEKGVKYLKVSEGKIEREEVPTR